MRRAIEDAQNFGVEVDIWKIEGVDERSDAEMLAEQARTGEGREGVTCVLLGRGASTEKVEQWLEQAAPVEGFIGFAIGRSIWWDALKGIPRRRARPRGRGPQIADNYLHFVEGLRGRGRPLQLAPLGAGAARPQPGRRAAYISITPRVAIGRLAPAWR